MEKIHKSNWRKSWDVERLPKNWKGRPEMPPQKGSKHY